MKKIGSWINYSLIGSAIFAWWGIAFLFSPLEPADGAFESHPLPAVPLLDTLTPIDRNELLLALQGDIVLMTKWIANWEIEAQILENQGIRSLRRLNHEDFLRSQSLGRKLQKEQTKACHSLRKPACSYRKLLPQTYASASFLLALADHESILAIPSGLRAQKVLYPPEVCDHVPRDVASTTSEELYLLKPDVAFIADYSHPSMVQALRNQGVRLVTLAEVRDVEDLLNNLILVGKTIDQPMKAELLSLFIEASLYAIDNRVITLKQLIWNEQQPNILYLCYHTHYSTPSSTTLTGRLLQRLGINSRITKVTNPTIDYQWKIPLDYEEILHLAPDSIIFASDNPEEIYHHLYNDRALGRLSAIKNHRISIVNETIQESPTQFVVLAYFDLYEALLRL